MCGRTTQRLRKGLCSAHYFRLRRTGETGDAAIKAKRPGLCDIDGCEVKAEALGYCLKHYTRHLRHGDPLKVGAPLLTFQRGRAGWDGDAGYRIIHESLRKLYGVASRYKCTECDRQAKQWAYQVGCTEKQSSLGPFSTDLEAYKPMCIPCHKRLDLARIASTTGNAELKQP